MHELVLEGNVYLPSGLKKCCVAIENEKIVSIKKVLKGEKHIDVGDKLIIPGCIDIHVHFRDPGFTHKEDFGTGTAAAASGGVTCCFDMPNTLPPTVNAEALDEKIRIASSKSHIDFGVWGGIGKKDEMEKISDSVMGFKLFISPSTHSYRQGMNLEEAVRACSRMGKILAVHCENDNMFSSMTPRNLKDYSDIRNEDSEAESVRRVSEYEKIVHACHISSPLSLGYTQKISCECTPHHILLDYESFGLPAPFGKVNPPLRSGESREEVFNAFISARIPVISSDHAPHTYEEKDVKFEDSPAGLPGVETCLPLLLIMLKNGKIDLKRIIEGYSSIPSEMFGLNKGSIDIGRDADIVIVDMRKDVKIYGKKLHSKCGWTPYEKKYGIFPRYVFVRGEMIVDSWEFVGSEGHGRNVRCSNAH